MNGTMPPYAMSRPLTRPQPSPTITAVKQDAREAVLLGGHRGRPHRGEGDDRADRQVDAAAGDDEGHADGDDADDGRLGEDELEVAGVQELVGLGDAADDDQDGEHAEQGEVADVGAQAECAQAARRCRRGGRGGRCPGSASSRGPWRSAPHGASGCVMTSGSLPSRGRVRGARRAPGRAAVCTTRPSRSTSTRSARPRTSGTSLETSSTARPSSASRRITAYSSARAPTSTPRVGSSSSRTRQPRSSQRASTAFCWLPPERVRTGASGLSGRSDSSRVAARAAVALGAPVEPAGRGRSGTGRRRRRCG